MYEYEEKSDIIGSPCSLMNPYKGYTEGTIVGDYGNTVVVRLTSGKEIVVLKRYFVKQYGHITEYYAIDKTALRSMLYGRIEVIVEVP